MSQPPLPEDLARWPTDPCALLGVQPGVAPRELRRAYTRLIRFYKPERYPEQFRRIRSAYEAVLSHVAFFEDEAEPSPEPPVQTSQPAPSHSPDADERTEQSAGDDTPEADGERTFKARQPPVASTKAEDLDDFWQQAIQGEEQAAYQRLRDWEARRPGHPEACARLYWLLALCPHLEPDRSPCEWLTRGLKVGGLAGPLRELYRRELAAHPDEALTERCAELLNVPSRPGHLIDLVIWRWQAAAVLQRYDIIRADLPGLRPRLGWGDESEWARVLFAATDSLAWSFATGDRQLFAICGHEVYGLAYLAEQMPGSFDRLDMLCELAPGWQRLYRGNWVPRGWRELMPLSWCRSIEEVRPLLYRCLERIAAAPVDWLSHFDVIQRQAPMLLTYFGQLLRQLEMTADEPIPAHDSATLQKVSLDFLASMGRQDYRQLRLRLLEFCLREAIPPEQAAAVATRRPAEWPASQMYLNDRVNADWPLRYVYQACQVLWA